MSIRLRDYVPELREDEAAKRHEASTKRYADLPPAIRSIYSEHEYQFMPDSMKAGLVQRENEPEWDE
jgi:hypothetical protein